MLKQGVTQGTIYFLIVLKSFLFKFNQLKKVILTLTIIIGLFLSVLNKVNKWQLYLYSKQRVYDCNVSMIRELAFQYSIGLFFTLVIYSGSSNFSQQFQSLRVGSCGHLVDLQENIYVDQFEKHTTLTK